MSDNIGVGDYQGLSESYKEDIDKLRKENGELLIERELRLITFKANQKLREENEELKERIHGYLEIQVQKNDEIKLYKEALKTAEDALDHLNYYKKCTCKDLKKVAAELPCQYCTCTKTLEVIKNLREGEE